MTVLAFDTSTTGCSAALVRDGRILASRFEEMRGGQAERLLPMVGEIMREAGLAFGDLNAVATTTGPGSFTGLRVGLSAAQGISLAAGIPGIGVTTFDALVARFLESHGPGNPAWPFVCVESKREDVFVQLFNPRGLAEMDPQARLPADIPELLPDAPIRMIGDAARRVFEGLPETAGNPALDDDHRLVRAISLGRLAESRLRAGGPFPPLIPLYMRPPDAKAPRDGGRPRRLGKV